MSAPTAELTVEQAVRVICQARSYRPPDMPRLVAWNAQLRAGARLNEHQRRTAHRLLAAYDPELRAATDGACGYEQIISPEQRADPHPATQTAARRAAGVDPDAPEQIQPSMRTVSAVQISADGHTLEVRAPYMLREITKACPVLTWDKNRKIHRAPATAHGARGVHDALQRTGINGDERYAELLVAERQQHKAGRLRSLDDLPPIPNSTYDGWLHQRQAFWFGKQMPALVLDAAMGTGKTKIVTDLLRERGTRSALIVCPERVVGVWPNEIRIHNGGKAVHVVDPRRQKRDGRWELVPIAKRVEMYEQALHECDCGLPHYLISNYAAAAHAAFADWSLRQHFDVVAYDEAHRLRSPNGSWSKWAAKMHSRADNFIGGTGTLQPQIPPDVFGPFRAIEPGLFGDSITTFRATYCQMGGTGDQAGKIFKKMKPEMEPLFAEKIATITYSVGAEVLDLPPEVPDVRLTCQLNPAAMKAYKTFEKDLYVELAVQLANGDITEDDLSAPNALVKFLRLCQMASGAVPGDSGQVLEIDTSKRQLLQEDLEDIPAREPVVVFARFRHDLDSIEHVARVLKRPYHELSGRRDDALSQHGKLADDVVIAGVQIQAGGTGIDFTRSAYGIYYSVGTSLSDYLQSRARLSRPGQTRSVRFRHLVAEGTIDETIYAALAARESVTKRIGLMIRKMQREGRL